MCIISTFLVGENRSREGSEEITRHWWRALRNFCKKTDEISTRWWVGGWFKLFQIMYLQLERSSRSKTQKIKWNSCRFCPFVRWGLIHVQTQHLTLLFSFLPQLNAGGDFYHGSMQSLDAQRGVTLLFFFFGLWALMCTQFLHFFFNSYTLLTTGATTKSHLLDSLKVYLNNGSRLQPIIGLQWKIPLWVIWRHCVRVCVCCVLKMICNFIYIQVWAAS